jgi:hypothetical protein
MKVLCINDDFSKVLQTLLEESKGLNLTFPKKGEEYTIREVLDNNGLVVSYLLVEITNPTFFIPVLNIRRELSFAEWRFSKLHTQESVEEFVENAIYSL